jgi:hypothetical protein
VQGDDDRHLQPTHQVEDVLPVAPAEDPVLVLDEDHVRLVQSGGRG